MLIKTTNRFAFVDSFLTKNWGLKGVPDGEMKKMAELVDKDKPVEGYDKELLEQLLHFATLVDNYCSLDRFISITYEHILQNYNYPMDVVTTTFAQFALMHTKRYPEWERRHKQPAQPYAVWKGSKRII